VPAFYAALNRDDISQSATHAEFESSQTGWYRIPVTTPTAASIQFTTKDKRGSVLASWVQTWQPMAGGPVTAAITGGGSMRWDTGASAIAYDQVGSPALTADVWLEVGDRIFWTHTGMVGAPVVSYLGTRRPVEQSYVV
jgi:hypothetical protein